MVGEFPELQGLMGRYYATRARRGRRASPPRCEEHYKPQGPSDRIPTDPVSIAVALADKLDTLVGFWAIDEKPTGSKDPYALRRAALGVIRIVLENELRLRALTASWPGLSPAIAHRDNVDEKQLDRASRRQSRGHDVAGVDLLEFFVDRLKVYLRDKGADTI